MKIAEKEEKEEETIEKTEIPETTEKIEVTEIETITVIERIVLREETTIETIDQETKEGVNVTKIVNMMIEGIEETTTIALRVRLPDTVMIEMKEEKITTVNFTLFR